MVNFILSKFDFYYDNCLAAFKSLHKMRISQKAKAYTGCYMNNAFDIYDLINDGWERSVCFNMAVLCIYVVVISCW